LIVNDLEQAETYMQFQEKATKNSILGNFRTTLFRIFSPRHSAVTFMRNDFATDSHS